MIPLWQVTLRSREMVFHEQLYIYLYLYLYAAGRRIIKIRLRPCYATNVPELRTEPSIAHHVLLLYGFQVDDHDGRATVVIWTTSISISCPTTSALDSVIETDLNIYTQSPLDKAARTEFRHFHIRVSLHGRSSMLCGSVMESVERSTLAPGWA